MACTEYLVVDTPDCLSPITVNADLAPLTNYVYRVQGDSGAAYWNPMATDADGAFNIDTSLFPDDYFNRFSGLYFLQVYDATTHLLVPVKGVESIALRFQKTNLTEAVIL